VVDYKKFSPYGDSRGDDAGMQHLDPAVLLVFCACSDMEAQHGRSPGLRYYI